MSLPPGALPANREELDRVSAAEWKAILGGDTLQARQWLEAAAALGHAEAQAVLGEWLLDGRGGKRDAEAALKWFLKAAAQRHPMGINMAGRCYENGWGVATDLPRAAAFYRQAADLGLPAGMYNHANQLASGKAVPQDHRKALGWYSQAASLGYAKAMTKAGRYFEDGIVVDQDLGLALSSYKSGAEGGDFRGQFCYAGMLAAQGNLAEALRWLRKVPETATAAYLAEAGKLLQAAAHEEFRRVGQDMLALAAARSAP